MGGSVEVIPDGHMYSGLGDKYYSCKKCAYEAEIIAKKHRKKGELKNEN
ncbi:MAG: hypothetical protein OEY10_00060 [Nitrosopumilus sp.]|nr:hypothetical protein [Nitrosopumilus sp.]